MSRCHNAERLRLIAAGLLQGGPGGLWMVWCGRDVRLRCAGQDLGFGQKMWIRESDEIHGSVCLVKLESDSPCRVECLGHHHYYTIEAHICINLSHLITLYPSTQYHFQRNAHCLLSRHPRSEVLIFQHNFASAFFTTSSPDSSSQACFQQLVRFG